MQILDSLTLTNLNFFWSKIPGLLENFELKSDVLRYSPTILHPHLNDLIMEMHFWIISSGGESRKLPSSFSLIYFFFLYLHKKAALPPKRQRILFRIRRYKGLGLFDGEK